jgi:hypothetical protein
MSEPSDHEVLEVVKLWADAAGVLVVDGSPVPWGWRICHLEGSIAVGHADAFSAPTVVSVDTALVWSLAVASGRSVDIGRCPVCEGSKVERRRGADIRTEDRVTGEWADDHSGWELLEIDPTPSDVVDWWVRGCQTCVATPGRVTREAARLVLDALPRPVAAEDVWLREAMAEAHAPRRTGRTTRLANEIARWLRESSGRVLVVVDLGGASLREQLRAMVTPGDALRIYCCSASETDGPFVHGRTWSRAFVDHHALAVATPQLRTYLATIVTQINNVGPELEPGVPTSIEALGVWSDAWLGEGDPLGLAVRHWLATLSPGPRVEHFGWRAAAVAGLRAAWARLTIECTECEGTGRRGPFRDRWPPELLRACTGCAGHGRVKPRPGVLRIVISPEQTSASAWLDSIHSRIAAEYTWLGDFDTEQDLTVEVPIDVHHALARTPFGVAGETMLGVLARQWEHAKFVPVRPARRASEMTAAERESLANHGLGRLDNGILYATRIDR